MDQLIESIKAALGAKGFLEGDDISETYRRDQSEIRAGDPRLVMRPASTEQVSRVLALCNAAGQPIIPQGGMTGLVDSAVPMAGELVLTLDRMRKIVALDGDAATLTVEAGIPLQAVQEYADDHGYLFPLDLGARGSCTIGGNLSTNAGGNRVVRYGMARDMVLGLEAVLADGTVISALNKMAKNNAGYDLKHLFIGSEGTLGVITKAVLKLWPQARSQSVAFCALTGFDAVTRFLHHCRDRLGGGLSAFEAFWPSAYRLVLDRAPTVKPPLPDGHPFYVLVESMGGDQESDAARFQATLEGAAEDGLLIDAVIAKSTAEIGDLWAVRDGIPEGLFSLQPMLNYDISLPLGDMDRIARKVEARMDQRFPGHRTIYFGHIGDGNLHISTNVGADGFALYDQVDDIIYGLTGEASGSISAEHGIGFLKRGHLHHSRTDAEIALMRTLKNALDPRGILSAGRVLPRLQSSGSVDP